MALSSIPQPNVPEPAMPWAREITRMIHSLTGDSSRSIVNNAAVSQQLASTTSAVGVVTTKAEDAQAAADAVAAAQALVDADLLALEASLDALDVMLTSAQTDLDAAELAVIAAQGTANTASTAAATAQTAANTAQTQANTATTDAATAQTQANTATTNAATAAGIANAKAVVLYQTTAPAAAYRNALTLWIDTTSNLNTPKKWVSGTTWAAVTDKVATDAATAAATAQTAAATAQTQANTATTNAATAQTAANNAATAAGTAQTTADGKNKIIFSTAVATPGTYAAGDTWFQKSGSIIIGQWEYVAGAWAPRTLDNAVIANLDAGKISVGTLDAARIAVGTLDANKLVAGTIVTDNMTANTISGDRLTANTIAANKLVANSITTSQLSATAIDASTITGATFRTAASGARVVLDSTGLKGYDASSVVKTSLSTGGLLTAVDAVITGTMKTGTSGQRAEISSTSVKFYSPSNYLASVYSVDDGAAGAALVLNSSSGALTIGNNSLPQGGAAVAAVPSLLVSGDLTVGGHIVGGQSAPYAMSAGTQSNGSTIGPGTGITLYASFPAGRFSTTPVMVCSSNSSRLTVTANQTNQYDTYFRVDNWSTGNAPGPIMISWTAVQMTPTTGAG